MQDRSQFDADVAIVGAGPVGTLVAVILGLKGHKATVVKEWSQPYDQPRAVIENQEIARILSVLGVDSDHDGAVIFHEDMYFWKNPAGQDLAVEDWGSIICLTDPAEAVARNARMIEALIASDGNPVQTDVAQLGKGF